MTTANLLALQLAKGLPATASNIHRLAKETSVEAARWAFGQWELRSRARAKFSLADQMLFTKEALEQSTHEVIAAYHASRFPSGERVFDMTCGIGADLIALARKGPSFGLDLELERLDYAKWNLAVHGLEAEFRNADSLTQEIGDFAFCDPSRRTMGKRTSNPADFAPNPLLVAEKVANGTLGGIKLSPMLDDGFLESFGGELEFVSFGGQCREALVWLGSSANKGRGAVHVETGDRLESSDTPIEIVEVPGRYFYEADPAAIRAHCLPGLKLVGLGDSNGYLTADDLVESPWLAAYTVLAEGKWDERAVLNELKKLDAKTPDIKQRVTNFDLQKLRPKLRCSGKRTVWVALWSQNEKIRYAVLEK